MPYFKKCRATPLYPPPRKCTEKGYIHSLSNHHTTQEYKSMELYNALFTRVYVKRIYTSGKTRC